MRKLITLFVNPVRIILVAATCLFAFGCSENDENYGTGRLMSLRWDNLPLDFSLSDASRIEVTTPSGTQLRKIGWGRLFYLDNPDEPIESVRVHFGKSGVAIPIEGNDASVSGGQLSITCNYSGMALVYNRETLDAVRANLAGNYLQIDHIDLSGENWVPIGPDKDHPFTGTYDGCGFEIRGMTVDVSGSENVCAGLFGVNGGTLRDIHIDAESSVSGTTTGEDGIVSSGGVCGWNYIGTISACSNNGSVSGNGKTIYSGGVCGQNLEGTISVSSNSGEVSVTPSLLALSGGVCGVSVGTISTCSNSGSVSGSSIYVFCGGVCGVSVGTISTCSNSGLVSGTGYEVLFGGVCGCNYNSGAISACSNSGAVSGTGLYAFSGGVCGENRSTIDHCYWGGASETIDKAVGQERGETTATYKYGSTAWPTSELAGWGDTAPTGWNVEEHGAWTNPWASLGAWNGGAPTFPTLK